MDSRCDIPQQSVRSCEICQALNAELLVLRIETYQLNWFGHVSRKALKRWLHPRQSGPEVDQKPGAVITSPPWLSPVLVWSQENYHRLLLTASFFSCFGLLLSLWPSREEKLVWKWMQGIVVARLQSPVLRARNVRQLERFDQLYNCKNRQRKHECWFQSVSKRKTEGRRYQIFRIFRTQRTERKREI